MIHLVVNPAAGGGVAPARVRAARDALAAAGDVLVHETQAPGDEERLGAAAADDGAVTCVVAMGGDGTVSGVVRGLMARARRPPLAVLAEGTGNDFMHGLRASVRDPAATARAIIAGTCRPTDVGIADGVPFINAAGLGFDVAVLDAMRASRVRASRLAYARAAARELLGYRGFAATLPFVDDRRRDWLMVVFANGSRFGGGIRIAPAAATDDGTLDAVAIASLAPSRRITLFARAMAGRHLTHASVHHARGSAFDVVCDAPPLMELDGEVRRASAPRVAVRIVPRAIELVVSELDWK